VIREMTRAFEASQKRRGKRRKLAAHLKEDREVGEDGKRRETCQRAIWFQRKNEVTAQIRT